MEAKLLPANHWLHLPVVADRHELDQNGRCKHCEQNGVSAMSLCEIRVLSRTSGGLATKCYSV